MWGELVQLSAGLSSIHPQIEHENNTAMAI